MTSSRRRYPEQTPVLARRALVQLLLLAVADVENPAGRKRDFRFPKDLLKSIPDFQRHTPDAAVLTANGGVLAGGIHTHVVQRGLPRQVVRAPELGSSVGLRKRKRSDFSVVRARAHQIPNAACSRLKSRASNLPKLEAETF